jgi:serine/threonine protein phosphatase 1
MAYIEHFALNVTGRDFAVGDIHGHFSKLQTALDRIDFNPAKDRLFSVGDMVDRGEESLEVLRWFEYPWFHAVRGNHEDYACRWRTVDVENWVKYGGHWFQQLSPEQKRECELAFKTLPFVIEVATAEGIVGIAHADIPCRHWQDLPARLRVRRGRDHCLWSRQRIRQGHAHGIEGVRAVVVGHEPLPAPVVLGNVYHIDTGGWMAEGYFTLLDLHSLTAVTP